MTLGFLDSPREKLRGNPRKSSRQIFIKLLLEHRERKALCRGSGSGSAWLLLPSELVQKDGPVRGLGTGICHVRAGLLSPVGLLSNRLCPCTMGQDGGVAYCCHPQEGLVVARP